MNTFRKKSLLCAVLAGCCIALASMVGMAAPPGDVGLDRPAVGYMAPADQVAVTNVAVVEVHAQRGSPAEIATECAPMLEFAVHLTNRPLPAVSLALKNGRTCQNAQIRKLSRLPIFDPGRSRYGGGSIILALQRA